MDSAYGIPGPRAGIELWPPALQGELLTTGQSGKSLKIFFNCIFDYLGLRDFFLPTCKSLNFSFHNGQLFSEVTFLCSALCEVAHDYKPVLLNSLCQPLHPAGHLFQ